MICGKFIVPGFTSPPFAVGFCVSEGGAVFGILAVVTFGAGYLEQADGAHTGAWASPAALTLLGLFFLALHVLGADRWIPRP